MKNINILFFILFAYFSCNAQDPQLFENTWYLQNLIIDGQDNLPPNNEDVPFITVSFNENLFFTFVCDGLDGIVIYNNSQFSFDSWSMTLGGCFGINATENAVYQGIYLGEFFISNIDNPFTYSITDEGSSKTLVIFSSNGDEAIYSSVLLSTQDYSTNLFTILPNPVKDELFISGTIDWNDFTVNIFNINGKLILSVNDSNLNNKSIDVQKLNSGIYFILLKDKNGRSIIKKFIKN